MGLIVACEVRPFRLRLRRPLSTAKGPIGVRAGVLLVLGDDAGRRGFGEASPIPGFVGEDAAASDAALEDLIPHLRGRRSEDRDDLLDLAEALAAGAPAARFAIDTALADLASQQAGLCMADWLAGGRAPRHDVPVSALVSEGDGPVAIAQGFEVLKLKVGAQDLESDLERVESLRHQVGPAARIRLDANGAWSFEKALTALRALERFDIEYLEEPVTITRASEVELLAELQASSRIPLAADECLVLPEIADLVLARAAARAVVLKPSVLGGLRASRRLAERAQSAGLQAIVTSGIDGAVAVAAAAHLAASLECDLPACGLATSSLLRDDLAQPLSLARGRIDLPSADGLGVAVDRESPWLADRAAEAPDALALQLPDRSFTYAELEDEARARWQEMSAHGVAAGDRVGLWLDSSDLALTIHAALLGGAVVLPLNRRLTPREVEFQIQDSRVRWLVRDGEIQGIGGSPGDVRGSNGLLDPDRPVAILYTSGTAGQPKGAVLSAANFRASARASRLLLGSTSDDRTLACMPLYHVGGLVILVRALLVGSGVVVHERFDAEAVARSLDEDRITDVSLVASMLERVLDVRAEAKAPGSLRNVLVGGGPVTAALLERARALGYPVAPTYGLTEATSQVATRAPRDQGASGLRALPGVEIEIDAAPGLPGEIRVRGANVMQGYLGRPAETARALRDGWLRTGDIGVLHEDGTLTVLDRRSDLIVSGGENVYPAEIEAVLLEHPAVAEAGVGRVADERFGARPAAWWVAASGHPEIDDSDLQEFCRNRLASFKVPVRFRRVEALPRTSSGKLVRRRLGEAGY